ncbi:transcriptional repressor [Pontibacter qinzhouensis]|uniref:Transcriptional repressor n=1 Tax=Pontibacter qinzhouensis TaxID=2603253 RepID=A0A5C8JHV3_9BACT|nr:Fur family transcriptional regulator [Pontibacter qinzhouensis]TXK36941.1 transcriptional repressor [Pontibacter qinzhouensis]
MLQDLDKTLQQKGVRPTAMRLLVLDYLLKQPAAVSLSDLEAYFHRADRITLYRSLKTFEGKGLVHSIDDGSGAVKYALCPDDCTTLEHHDLHVHFFCSQCRETFCLPKSRIPDIALPEKFKTEEVNLLVKGTCGTCSG